MTGFPRPQSQERPHDRANEEWGTHDWTNEAPPHWAARMHARELREGKISRREFLTRSTTFGVSTAAAYAMIGQVQPASASAPVQQGGTLRVQMGVPALKDPRAYDWPELGNLTRSTLEYLVQYNNDGSFTPMLLDGWQINEDATEYTLALRKGVTWHNGEAFTAQDVARNITGWCDRSFEGNSMAGRFDALVDPQTQRAIAGAIEVVDTHTVRLHLPRPDISLIASMSDYPAAMVHKSFQTEDITANIGTGPYALTQLDPGVTATLERVSDHNWWGGSVFGRPALDRIEYLDFGTDPSSWLAALEEDKVDLLHQTVGEFIDALDVLGYKRTNVVSMGTLVIRPNQRAEVNGIKPYADLRVRRALQLAVDNAVCLELGYDNRGIVAENHHVGPAHPEYAPLAPQDYDPVAARALMDEAGMLEFEHELISIDDDWRKNTTDAVAAQLRDAGFKVKRTILPAAVYSTGWQGYAFSSTNWNHRPLGVQVLALAYRSGAIWNEFGWSNATFDALLDEALSIANADQRRTVMAKIEALVQDEAVTLQPYWQSYYNHMRQGVVGAQKHIAHEHHHYKWGWAAS